jgi:hypothetical protein
LLVSAEEDLPASLFDNKRPKNDSDYEPVRHVERGLYDAVFVRTPISKISQVAIRGQACLRISFAQ